MPALLQINHCSQSASVAFLRVVQPFLSLVIPTKILKQRCHFVIGVMVKNNSRFGARTETLYNQENFFTTKKLQKKVFCQIRMSEKKDDNGLGNNVVILA